MQDDNYPQPAQPVPESPSVITMQQSADSTKILTIDNKKLLIWIAGILGSLLLILIILLAMLLVRGAASSGTNGSEDSQLIASSQKEAERGTDENKKREVLATVPTGHDSLEYVIYKPQQNTANTTIYFAIKNNCTDSCDQAVDTRNASAGFKSSSGSYLINSDNTKKYGVIRDQDGEVLATSDCNDKLTAGESLECFVSFAKVPNGSTVSWVFSKNRIDNIKVE